MSAGISLTHRLTQTLFDQNSEEFTAAAFPFIPLTEPGMPPGGPDFIAHAIALGDDIDAAQVKKKKTVPVGTHLTNLYRDALYKPDFHMPISHKSSREPVSILFLPGHKFGQKFEKFADDDYGPRARARVMVVGKLPGSTNWLANTRRPVPE